MSTPVPVLKAPAEWTSERAPAVDATARGLLGDTGSRLVVDLSQTTFLASIGITSLIRLGKRLADAGGGVALAHPTSAVVKLFRTIGLTRVLPLFDTVDEARAYLTSARFVPSRP